MGHEGEQQLKTVPVVSDEPEFDHDRTPFIHQQEQSPQQDVEFDPVIHGPQICPGVTAVVSLLLAIVSNAIILDCSIGTRSNYYSQIFLHSLLLISIRLEQL